MAEQTAFNSTCDASSNIRLFAKSSFKNLTTFDIYKRASINAKLLKLACIQQIKQLRSRPCNISYADEV
ncbi:hypothetical protein GOBAR_AA39013 [Gossypium barbadense]|uniref:Uncharacterized protein n=1 Tax=Gossypium barbadense TaxID=3634 RepID=A0A2P5VSC2_GOSBA|nr:hypothetical protein GOBAR_AA39013 [Gossypium barbadense]